MSHSKLRGRKELPAIARLPFQFEIKSLQQDLEHWGTKLSWDSLDKEYQPLCENHYRLPPRFATDQKQPGYTQLACTGFDPSASLQKDENPWSHRLIKNKPEADERFYRKKREDLPTSFKTVLDFFSPEVHRARLAKLAAGEEIQPHIDYDPKYSIRIHIPLITHSDCVMGFYNQKSKQTEIHLPADGSCYFLNPGLKHWVKNPSPIDRVHLIMSVDGQKFLSEMEPLDDK